MITIINLYSILHIDKELFIVYIIKGFLETINNYEIYIQPYIFIYLVRVFFAKSITIFIYFCYLKYFEKTFLHI